MSARPGREAIAGVVLACAVGWTGSGSAAASPVHVAVARADAPSALAHDHPASSSRSPSGPPLSSGVPGAGAGIESEDGEDQGADSAGGEADPLVSNGLGSPTCRSGIGAELAPSSRRDCETAGFLAAPAPTGNYGIDIHIDTGALGLGSGWLSSTVQNVLVSPLWMALVWIVHALIVMLEWCFSIDLLDRDAGGLGSGLAQGQASLTMPWLPLALAVAAALTAYKGLVRRRVADTLGEALMMGAMIAGGMWLIVDPTGTVGALGRWANQAGLGAFAVAVQGAPASPGRALGVSMGGVFVAAIEAPWCYLEFGNVNWCRDPAQLDPRLRSAGLEIAREELARAECSGAAAPCASESGGSGEALLHSGRLLREARTNGAIFLALPANGAARNSINDPGSLLRAICQDDEARSCSGPAAAEAEFRTNSGTWSRMGGLLLIVAGVLGMALLLGYVALRLLLAAILSIFYLLLAPGVVLAPAFGDPGRALFRSWLVRLFGAVVAKLVFAFLLGVVLAVMAVIGALDGLGWWTQWLLMSAFWWGAFTKRNQLLVAASAASGQGARLPPRSIGRRVADAVEGPRWVVREVRRRKERAKPAPDVAEAQPRTSSGRARKRAGPDHQALQLIRHEGREMRALAAERKAGLKSKRPQLERIQGAYVEAAARGETRRATRLRGRREKVSGELERARSPGRREDPQAALARRSAFLDEQAELPAAGRRDGSGRRRDYAALAPLAGYGRAEFERLDPRARLGARVDIDRELAVRRERLISGSGSGRDVPRSAASSASTPARARASTGEEGPQRDGELTPVRRGRVGMGPRRAEAESPVMRDAREIAAGRKRQFGPGRP